MTDNDANEMFEQIIGAEGNADLADVQAPEGDPRKDGVYYAADEANASVYHVIVDHRVVAHAIVSHDPVVPTGQMAQIADQLIEGSTFHQIVLATPDRDPARTIWTSGLTFKKPGGIFNRTYIRCYLGHRRLARLLVRLYGIGA